MGGYEGAILECLAIGDLAMPIADLQTRCAQHMQQRLDIDAFTTALQALVTANEIRIQGQKVLRIPKKKPVISVGCGVFSEPAYPAGFEI